MAPGGYLLTITHEDLKRSKNRVRTKIETDGPDEYSGPPVQSPSNLNAKQSRLVLYHKLFRYLYGEGRRGVRVILPSCCVTVIQQNFSDNQYPASAEESTFEI